MHQRSERIDPAVFGRSSNGRTTASDAVYLGSNPSLPAKTKTPPLWRGFCFGRGTGDGPRSTNLSGTNLDSRRLAPRSGVGPMDGTNNPSPPCKPGSGSVPVFVWLGQETTQVIRHFLCLALRTIGCTDVRPGILPPQSTILPRPCAPTATSAPIHPPRTPPISRSIPTVSRLPYCA